MLMEVWPVLIGTVMLTQGSYTLRYSQEKKAEQHEDSWDKYSDPFSIPYKARNICENFTVSVSIDTILHGLETPWPMIRSRHTYKNGVSFYLRQFCEAIIVKLTVLLVIEGL